RRFNGDKMYREGGVNIVTQEGTAAVKEAIEFLKQAKPMAAMTPSEGLALAARDHVNDTGDKGLTGHKGTDGSMPQDRILRHGKVNSTCGENIAYGPDEARSIVMQLIIDDGVANRGHRKNIFSADFKTAGVAMGRHRSFDTMCVITYADGFAAK
ncbi:MAG TPA: CAP domain-containing protein, partial [Luteolibacter sp.]|nr:CAP domain-containing protein [Luteolibacter sp.]